MSGLKFYHPQSHIPAEQLRERLRLARLYVDLTHTYYDLFFSKRGKTLGADFETLLVLVCVFIGDAEGRPTSVTKIASHARLPRQTVYRRLDQLCKIKKIVRVKHSYHLAPGAVAADDQGRIAKILQGFGSK